MVCSFILSVIQQVLIHLLSKLDPGPQMMSSELSLFPYLLDGLFLHIRQDDHFMPTVASNFSTKKLSFPIVLKENPQRELCPKAEPWTNPWNNHCTLADLVLWLPSMVYAHTSLWRREWAHPHWTIWNMSQGKRGCQPRRHAANEKQQTFSESACRVPDYRSWVKCRNPNETRSFLHHP